MPTSSRGPALTVFAVLFAVLAVSNLMKPLETSAEQGFVLLGHRLRGWPNLVAGPLFGILLLVYAAGIWRMKRWARPLGVAYATYVLANLITFRLWGPQADPPSSAWFLLAYAIVALGVSWGAAWILSRRRAELS